MEHIDKVFFINLDERTDRLEHVLNQCKIHELPSEKIERFPAINGKIYLFTKEELSMFKNAEFNTRHLTPLIIKKKLMGNQLSHFNILLEMKKRNYNNIIVFQDDVILKNGFVEYINLIMKDLPIDSEIINIGIHEKANCEYFEPYNLMNDTLDYDIIDNKITEFVYLYKTWNSKTLLRVNPASLAYIVTKKGCDHLLEHFYKNGFDYATDWNFNLYLQSKNIFYGSKYILATGNNSFISDVFVNTDNYLMEDLIDTDLYYTDKNTTHSYFDLYNKLFNPIRNQSKNILEIGIGNFGVKNGGSILLWKMYFKNALIHAVDIVTQNSVYDIILKNANIKTYLNTDAYNVQFVETLKKDNLLFDVILDDGPHTFESQCNCIKLYAEMLSDIGILVIEDIQDISWVETFKKLTPTHLRKYIHIYDLRHVKNRYDDIVFVINKNVVNDLYNTDIPLVISYETDMNNNNATMFKKTLNQNGWQHIFIGEGIKWNGFRDRVLAYYKQVELLNDDKIVLLSDARDVFCLRKPNFFINNVKNIVDKQIIISAEMFLNGHLNWSSEQIASAISRDQHFFWQGEPINNYWAFWNKTNDLPFRKYANAGLIVGKVSLLKNALQWIIDNNFNDDQLGYSKYTNQFPELVYLDYEAKYIHTSTGFVDASLYNHEIQIQDVPSFVELFGLSNYFLHIPGSNISKGQKHVYNAIYNLFEHNVLEKSMFNLYNLTGDRKHNLFISNDP